MTKPPDISNIPRLEFDYERNIGPYSSTQPVYLVMTRISEKKEENLTNVSPFLIKKAIDAACGEVLQCKKTRSGEILIQTKNSIQANKLTKLSGLTNNIKIKTQLHKTLNFAKGVIYANDLRGIEETEIVSELKSQNVHEAKKILRRNEKDNTLEETGLIILTFASSNSPMEINIGYEKVDVRPYFPLPLKCKTCNRFGHSKNFCKNIITCPTCANSHPIIENTKCYLPTKCINCSENNIVPNNHPSTDRKCPIFLKEKEITAIKTTYKVDNYTAKKIYNERHQHGESSYANTIKQQTNNNSINSTPNKKTTSTNLQADNSNRKPVDYSELNSNTLAEELPTTSKANIIVKIAPKNTPKRLVRKLQREAKTTTTKKTTQTASTDNISSEGDMDYTEIEEQL